MKFITYKNGGGAERAGALLDGGAILDLAAAEELTAGAASGRFASMLTLIEGGDDSLDAAQSLVDAAPSEAIAPGADVTLCAPLPTPVRLRDAGLFIEHLKIIRKEMARLAAQSQPDPDAALVELLRSDQFQLPEVIARRACYYNGNHLAAIGPDTALTWPLDVEVIDYELELAIVVGRGGFNLSAQDTHAHVFGYTLMND